MFEDAGCTAVDTYIQSGNVVFQAEASLAARIPALITREIDDRFGYRVPVVTRTAEDLREVVRENPFLRAGVDQVRLHVAFLAQVPDDLWVADLEPQRSPPDLFQARGRDIFLHCPDGVARTKLTNAYFDSKLTTTITVRNWRTVTALLEMADRHLPLNEE